MNDLDQMQDYEDECYKESISEIRVLGYTISELIEMENFAKEYGWKRPEYPVLVFPDFNQGGL